MERNKLLSGVRDPATSSQIVLGDRIVSDSVMKSDEIGRTQRKQMAFMIR